MQPCEVKTFALPDSATAPYTSGRPFSVLTASCASRTPPVAVNRPERWALRRVRLWKAARTRTRTRRAVTHSNPSPNWLAAPPASPAADSGTGLLAVLHLDGLKLSDPAKPTLGGAASPPRPAEMFASWVPEIVGVEFVVRRETAARYFHLREFSESRTPEVANSSIFRTPARMPVVQTRVRSMIRAGVVCALAERPDESAMLNNSTTLTSPAIATVGLTSQIVRPSSPVLSMSARQGAGTIVGAGGTQARFNSAFASEIAPPAALHLLAVSKVKRSLTPTLDVVAELLVPGVVERELVAAEPAEPAEHLGEDRWAEATILLGRELTKPLETVVWLDLHQIDEVAGFGASEEGEQLVDGELLS